MARVHDDVDESLSIALVPEESRRHPMILAAELMCN
jgi:hypothetical protein